MTSYSIANIKAWLRDQGYSEVERAQLLNLIEGHGELRYQAGLRDVTRPCNMRKHRETMTIIRGNASTK